jgi:PAS domain S-box-containing protein
LGNFIKHSFGDALSFDALASGWARVLGVDRKQFNMFFERMMDGFAYHKIIVDKAGKPVDFVFLEVNSAFEKLTGLKREQLIGKKVTEVLKGIENDPADWIGVYGRVALTGEPTQFENYAKPLDKWYRVNAYCPAKGYFVALFEEITDRKKVEESLKKQQDELQTIIDSSHSWIFYKDRENRFLRVNIAFAEVMEMPKEQLEGHSLFDLYPREQAEKFWEDDKQVMVSGVPKLGILEQMQTKKGQRWVQTDKIPYRDASGNIIGVIGFSVDITERKAAEDALRASEQRWSTTLSSIGDAVITTDLDGNVAFLNGIAEGLTGWSLAEASGKPLNEVFNIVNEKTRSRVESPVIRVLKEGLIVGLANHTVLIRKDGTEVPIDDSGAPIRDRTGKVTGVVLVFRDIAERKKAEAKIAEQAFMIANANDAIIGYDSNMRVTFWNKAAQQLYGYTSEEAMGKSGLDLLKPIYVNVAREELLNKVASEGHVETESIRQTKDGKSIDVEAHVILLRNEAGKPVGYVSVDRDITARKKAEEALRASEERYRHIVQYAPTAIYEVDFRGPTFRSVNDVMCQLTGYTREELLARSPMDLLDAESQARFAERIKKALSGQRIDENVEYKAIVKDGSVRWVILNVNLTKSDGGFDGALVVAHDVTERKKTEEALAKQAALIDLSPDAIIVKQLNGTITLWSHGAETLYGWSKEEAIGQTTHNLLKTDFPMPLNEILMQVASRGLWSGELIHTTKAGRKLFVQSHWLGRFGKNKETVEILETNVDISERKQMQDKLEEYAKNLEGLVEERTKQVTEERQRMYNVLETLPAYVVLLDKDYNVPFANKVFRERFGESHGRHCYDFLFKRDSPCENCETYKVLKTNKPHRWEWTGPDKRDYDIYDFPFTEADGSTLILEMGIDITQRKKAEARVQAASLYSRSLIEASLDPLVTISPEGKITDVNEATVQATGCSRQELIGSDFCDYFTEPDKAKAGYKQVFTEGFVKDYPLAIRHKSGRITDVLYNAAVYRNEAGEIQGVFAAARDITERKKAEAQAEEIARKLKDAERLAAIGATAGMVGHDIRNPLQAIIGDLYLAKSDVTCLPSGELKDSLTESLDAIQKSVDYVNKIVLDLQDYAKPLKPVLHDTNLHAIINDILKKTDTPKNIKIQQRITEDARTLKVDPDLLKRILGNLISNAIQAMPDGGKLTIKATKKKDAAFLTVKDTGAGIPEAAKPNLFTPLFTTKSKGQGFGLAVVKRMTEALGGTVTFESEESKGAEFTIRLPQEANRK